ncbi:hypothetical protein ACG7TL_003883 [Trametes sanguinea]
MLRASAGFLLGWVFWSSISYAYQSQFFQQLGRICWRFIRSERNPPHARDIEAMAFATPEKGGQQREQGRQTAAQRISNESALVFTLNLCFAFASFAKFCSILAYDPGGANTACAFTIAWGSMADQAARLVGLFILTLGLRARNARAVEFYSFVLAFNATNTGNIVSVQSLTVAICVVDRLIAIELLMIVRSLSWGDRHSGLRYMLRKSMNLQVARACSLLLLDVLTVAPNVVHTNVLARFVPFSLAALIVLTVESSPESSEKGEIIVIDTPMGQPRPVPGMKRAPPVLVPSSAPPRIGDAPVFEDLQARQILPFQVQYAERLERHIHTGPIVPSRPKRQRPHIQVVVQEIDSARASRSEGIPSTIIGSDIIRLPSAVAASRKNSNAWSSGSAVTPSEYTSRASSSAATPTTVVRDSNLSMATSTFSRSAYGGSRSILSGVLSRQASKKVRSPAETSLRMPWRSAPRASFASGRTFGGRDELPPVAEGQSGGASGALNTGSWRGSQSSAKRPVISHPHSLRSSKPASPRSARHVVTQLPAISSKSRPSSSQHLSVPEHLRSPITPEPPASIRPSSRYIVPMPPTSPPSGSYERAQGSGRLRGPRSPPMSGSSPDLRSVWPPAEPDASRNHDPPRHVRKRSDSCPELPPLDLSPHTLRAGSNAQHPKTGHDSRWIELATKREPEACHLRTVIDDQMASSELLKQIQAGKKLRKAETNDRSAPIIETPKGAGGGGRAGMGAPAIPVAPSSSGGGGPPQLGSLFAGGMPKLKPTGQSQLGKPPTLGKPPSIPKRETPSAPSAPPPPPNRPSPARPAAPPPPAPPARSAPSLPARSAPSLPVRSAPTPPSAPAPPAPPPRKVPAPPRPASPPSAPAIPPRTSSPASRAGRPVPDTPPRPASAQPHRKVPPPPPSTHGRAPPPPPPARPSSMAVHHSESSAGSPGRPVPPPPPARKATHAAPPPPPVRPRVHSETDAAPPAAPPPPPMRHTPTPPSSTPPPPPPPPPAAPPARHSAAPTAPPPPPPAAAPARHSAVPTAPPPPPPPGPSPARSRTSSGSNLRPSSLPASRVPSGLVPKLNGNGNSEQRRKMSGFPPPRPFTASVKKYAGGRQRGCNFDLGSL